jgi:hypothetical protein
MKKLSTISNFLLIVGGVYLMFTNELITGLFAICIGFQSFHVDRLERQAKKWEERYWKEVYKDI